MTGSRASRTHPLEVVEAANIERLPREYGACRRYGGCSPAALHASYVHLRFLIRLFRRTRRRPLDADLPVRTRSTVAGARKNRSDRREKRRIARKNLVALSARVDEETRGCIAVSRRIAEEGENGTPRRGGRRRPTKTETKTETKTKSTTTTTSTK